MSFYFENKYLYCEKLRVTDIQARVPESPFYLYSLAEITRNYDAYTSALHGTGSIVAFAFKANSNLSILRHLRARGSGAALVSGNELRLALAAGFDPRRTIYNGNGKTGDELRLAVEHGVMINVDSEFDLEHIVEAARAGGKPVDVLIRINPRIAPEVHPFVSTGIEDSKFGVRDEQVSWFVDRIQSEKHVHLVGFHCHLGSTIDHVDVFREAARHMVGHLRDVRRRGVDAKYLNIGGGLDIDYERAGALPDPADLVDSIRQFLTDDITLIIEPGRSIVGSAGALVCRVIGTKRNGSRRFIVTDGSMAELIRPSLYGAYHHIDFVEPVKGKAAAFDVVGPVCESADYLGKDRVLPTPEEGTGLVVLDAGAYGYVMSSNYNARTRPAEYLVDGDTLTRIRRPERFEDYMRLF